MVKLATAVLSCVCLIACQSSDSRGVELSLNEASNSDQKYRDTLVKVCGLATKEFENVQISDSRLENWPDNSVGLMVDWLENEPWTNGAEQRCVTGFVEPMCGWDDYQNTDLICLSTGSSFGWKIRQTSLARD